MHTRFELDAEVFETVWRARNGRTAPRNTSTPCVRFAVSDGDAFVRVIAVCPLTPALCAELRRWSRSVPRREKQLGVRSGHLLGGPRGLQSRWPAG